MKHRIIYAAAAAVVTVTGTAYFLPGEIFLAFLTGWLFLVPAAAIVFLAYGLREYMKERKNRIVVSIKPSEAMKALARREAELRKEKELLLEEFQRGIKRR